MAIEIYVGVDGGGSKTEVFGFSPQHRDGVICTGGPSNPVTVGWDSAVSAIQASVDSVVRALGGLSSDVRGLSLCVAGMDRPAQRTRLHAYFAAQYPGAHVEAANDALAALTAGAYGESGVVLIAGTGSIAVGEGQSKRTARAGGFGYLIGDEGSGFHLGRTGLMAAIAACEGRGPSTLLWDFAKTAFTVTHPKQLIEKIYESSHPVGRVATFASYVLQAAPTDAVAEEIVTNSVADYVSLIESVRHQLAGDVSDIVVLAGGILLHHETLQQALRSRLPDLSFRKLTLSPCIGAGLRATFEASGRKSERERDSAPGSLSGSSSGAGAETLNEHASESTDIANRATSLKPIWAEAASHVRYI